jgi:addiction module antitoxin, relB/dinJ family
MATTNYNIRLDDNLRERAFAVFESYGLSPSQAIKLFLNQVADTRTVPLSFDYKAAENHNEATRQSLIAARKEFKTAKRYNSLEEMMHDVQEQQT